MLCGADWLDVVDEQLLTLKTILHGVLAKGCTADQTDVEGRAPIHYAGESRRLACAVTGD